MQALLDPKFPTWGRQVCRRSKRARSALYDQGRRRANDMLGGDRNGWCLVSTTLSGCREITMRPSRRAPPAPKIRQTLTSHQIHQKRWIIACPAVNHDAITQYAETLRKMGIEPFPAGCRRRASGTGARLMACFAALPISFDEGLALD